MNKCRVCGNEKNSEFTVQEMMFGLHDAFLYFECSCCGCLQIKEVPCNIAKYYPLNYYSYNAATDSGSFVKKLLRRIRNNFAVFDKGIIGRLLCLYKQSSIDLRSLSSLNLKKDMRIIDVGCGNGKLLCTLQEIGFKALLGVDPFVKQNIDYANGVKIVKNELENINGAWDVVMFHHSFEHIFDQLGTLHSVYRLLDDRGTCLIRVPVTSSFAWRHYGINWVQLDAPRHFFLHSIQSMALLAEQAGFYVERVVYDSTSLQFIGSELYLKGESLSDINTGEQKAWNCFFSTAELEKFSEESVLLNAKKDGDQAAFYLRKIRA
ncbi:MAG TPA: class I SAM-dependent methyltransferase [Desulfuromonadaceae bacterium]|jgi:SAM-dependent methyltransferase